ncbi:MAG: DUF1667 domain-containing protein [Clostridia bacterium]|nr:DUF1667 domain-containing protein [Clostridia bacterium]
MKIEMTCIICPVGCNLEIETENKKIIKIKGNTCPRGEKYAQTEITNPVRTLTTTIRCSNGEILPVRTDNPIPKELIFKCMDIINNVVCILPISAGDIIIENILNTGSNIIASKEME